MFGKLIPINTQKTSQDEIKKWIYEDMSKTLAMPQIRAIIIIVSTDAGQVLVSQNGDVYMTEKMGLLDLAKQQMINECNKD